MKKTGKVTRIVENSTWKFKNDEGQTVEMAEFTIDFADLQNVKYKHPINLSFKVGDEIEYQYDQHKKSISKTKKLNQHVGSDPIQAKYVKPESNYVTDAVKQKYINRLSCLNRATDLHGAIDLDNYEQDLKLIIQTAKKFEEYVYEQ